MSIYTPYLQGYLVFSVHPPHRHAYTVFVVCSVYAHACGIQNSDMCVISLHISYTHVSMASSVHDYTSHTGIRGI